MTTVFTDFASSNSNYGVHFSLYEGVHFTLHGGCVATMAPITNRRPLPLATNRRKNKMNTRGAARTRNNTKKRGPNPNDTPEIKAHKKKVMNDLLDELDAITNSSTERVTRNEGKKIIDTYMSINGSWMTRDMIKSARKRRRAAARKSAENEINTEDEINDNRTPLEELQPVAIGGRKKGSTMAVKSTENQRFINMKNHITTTWMDRSKRPQGMTLQNWIDHCVKEWGFNTGKPEHRVTREMVKSRMKRKQPVNSGVKGQTSPLEAIEPRLVMLIRSATECYQELTEGEILSFVNSYIKGSELEQRYIDWKLRNVPAVRNEFVRTRIRPTSANVTRKWFERFLKRWKDEISYSKSKNTAHYRKEHCTYTNFERMYDTVYDLLVKGKYATKLNEPLYYNKDGEECERDQAYGKPVDVRFTRPELVFCADECGTNTNMANDRLSGGNKRVHSKGTTVMLPGCTSDVHFTTMGFTALDGRPVCCVVILQKPGPLNIGEKYGFDIDAKWNGDLSVFKEAIEKNTDPTISDELFKANTGEGRPFPGGPVCEFNGKRIPPLITSSESGGITPEILVEILKHLDEHGATDRKPGDPPPALIVDGHGSRLSLPFLYYINNLDENGNEVDGANHEWKVFVGLPNGTAYWQPADSSYINGRFKIKMRGEKEEVRDEQRYYGEKIEIKRHHIVLMIRNCWDKCFGDVAGNKKAILERGWNPLNRGCLVMPDVAKTRITGHFAPLKSKDNSIAALLRPYSEKTPATIEKTPALLSQNSEKTPATIEKTPSHTCAAKNLCFLKTPFTDKDKHTCMQCGGRVHGFLCCMPMSEDDQYKGLFTCKQCGGAGIETTEMNLSQTETNLSQTETNLSQTDLTFVTIDSTPSQYRSEMIEERLSQDPSHCMDMNPSSKGCFDIVSKLQRSRKRNIAQEKKLQEDYEDARKQRQENQLMCLATKRATMGAITGLGHFEVSGSKTLELFRTKNDVKLKKERSKLKKQFKKELTIYRNGLEAMEKYKEHEKVEIEVSNEPDKPKKRLLIREARKAKRWLLNDDYGKLIKFKLLGTAKEGRDIIPTKLHDRQSEWNQYYKKLSDPDEPTKPEGIDSDSDSESDGESCNSNGGVAV